MSTELLRKYIDVLFEAPLSTGTGTGLLRRGSRGPEVSALQTALGMSGDDVDGIFGPKTEKAVRQFQKSSGIRVDGIVGPETRGAIDKSGAEGEKLDGPEKATANTSTAQAGQAAQAAPEPQPATSDKSNTKADDSFQPNKTQLQRARDIAEDMGTAAPNLAQFTWHPSGIPLTVNGDPIPENLYKPEELRAIKGGQASPDSSATWDAKKLARFKELLDKRDAAKSFPAPEVPKFDTPPTTPDQEADKGQAAQSSTAAQEPDADKDSEVTEPGVEAVYKEVTGNGQSRRYTTYNANGDEVSSGRGAGPNLPTQQEWVAQQGEPADDEPADDEPTADVQAEVKQLDTALTAIEKIIEKYKVKTESIRSSISSELGVWRTLVEADPGPSTATKTGRAAVAGAEVAAVDAAATAAISKTSGWMKFAKSFGSKYNPVKGGAKGAATVAGKGASRFIPFLGWGLLAYDVLDSAYDAFTKVDMGDLDPADQQIIVDNLPIIMKYAQDKDAMSKLPTDIQSRIANVTKGLVALQATSEEQQANSAYTKDQVDLINQGVNGWAKAMSSAILGPGTNEEKIELVMSVLKTPQDWANLVQAYKTVTRGNDLYSDMLDDMNKNDMDTYVHPYLEQIGVPVPPQ